MQDLDLNSIKLLLVDDEAHCTKLMEALLKQAGYSRITATNDARQAAQLFQEVKPDLVALDMRNISAWVDEDRGVVVHIVWHHNARPPSTRVVVSVPAIEDYVMGGPEQRVVADMRFRQWLLWHGVN